ncbi:MAG: type III polyketide synthase, partial [Rhodomicrobium sp.]
MSGAYINEIATAVPPHQVHKAFVQFQRQMLDDFRKQTIFDRLVAKGQIENRWSCVLPADDLSHASINGELFYVPGNFP